MELTSISSAEPMIVAKKEYENKRSMAGTLFRAKQKHKEWFECHFENAALGELPPAL